MATHQNVSPTLSVILAAVEASSQSSIKYSNELSAKIITLSALPEIVNNIASRFHTFSQTAFEHELFEPENCAHRKHHGYQQASHDPRPASVDKLP